MAGFLGPTGGVTSAGQANAIPPRDVREASMGFAVESLDPTIQRLYQATVQLEGLVGRLMGPHPTPVNVAEKEQEPPSLIGKLNIRGRALAMVADRFDELVRQLDQML